MKKLFIAVLLLTIISPAWANIIKERGMGQITYTERTIKNETKNEALRLAKINAINRYAAKFDQAKAMNFEKVRPIIEAEIDKFVMDYNLVDEQLDAKAKRYSVVISATINESLINIELQKHSAVHQASSHEKSYLSFVFVAREQKVIKSFDDRVTRRQVEAYTEDSSESAEVDGSEMSFSGDTTRDYAVTTGGSTQKKADEIQYDVSTANEINVAMNKVFSTAGYEVVDAEYLADETDGLVDVDHFIDDYRYGEDISGETRRNAVKGCQMADVSYLAIGTLDVGLRDKDPVSGMTRVFVAVTGKVMDVSGRFPKTVASVGPVQFSGLGPNQTVAKNNALILAAEKAAQELTAQMRAKNIK